MIHSHKKVKIRLGDLKRVLREAYLLREVEGELEEPDTHEDGPDSLDTQVDKYLHEYEAEAKSAKTEGKDWRMTVRRLVSEAGQDDNDEGDQTAKAADADAASGNGDDGDTGLGDDEGGDDGEPKKLTADDLDVDSFVNSTVRLIDNYDSLLEVRNTILRRAANFLSKNYEPEVIENFKEKLRGEHGIEIGKSPEESANDEFPAPVADRAGDGGGGAGGAPA